MALTHWVTLPTCQHEWGKQFSLHVESHSRTKILSVGGEKLLEKLWSYHGTELQTRVSIADEMITSLQVM